MPTKPPSLPMPPAAPPVFVRPGPADGGDADALLRTEWLLTNGRGGFAMGTAAGAPARRYHGLLVASLRPPVQRIMALSNVAETIVIEPGSTYEQREDLSTFKFRPGVLHPRGDARLLRFEKDTAVRWFYQAGAVKITKQIQLFRDAPAAAIRYTISGAGKALRLLVRPLVALRDFHALILRDTSRDRFRVDASASGCVVHGPVGALHLAAGVQGGPAACVGFQRDEQWWYDFQYDLERDRGYDYLEDLFHPGVFVADIPAGVDRAVLTVTASVNGPCAWDVDEDERHRAGRLAALLDATRGALGGREPSAPLAALVDASDDFIVRRVPPLGAPAGSPEAAPERATVIAGYPWFADWGRDSMIALPGLMLVTGRFTEAREVLQTFAAHRSQGLVPNVFDDYTGQAHHNTVDASLWFIHAACQYAKSSGDALTFKNDLLPACLDIVEHYRKGTSFGVGVDPADGLVFAGDPSTQLTWMDAKRDGVAFTPRHGKAVEINALWFNALASIVELATGVPGAAELARLRDQVGQGFRAGFWDAGMGAGLAPGLAGGLIDTLAPGHHAGATWTPQREIRPNQIFAVSLPFSPLEPAQRAAVVRLVRARLLTPHGLRTLDPVDSRYKGRYRGTMFHRDSAYHNGTAWPWLLGPMAEAVLRVGEFSGQARAEARQILDPMLRFIDADCPGQLPEVFDGDNTPAEPQRAGGCPAQAWSVAEVLRVLTMIERVG